MNDKRALRAWLRVVRIGMADRAPPRPSPEFIRQLTAGVIVASYLPMSGEPDPCAFVAAATAAGCILALPFVVDRPTPIRFLAWQEPLVAGPFGLRQPAADAPELAPAIILTPLVGFDRHGNRLGQGAGHYDRAFAQYPGAWRIGLAWSVQEVPMLVPDPWDVPLHAIATETEWITP